MVESYDVMSTITRCGGTTPLSFMLPVMFNSDSWYMIGMIVLYCRAVSI